MTSKIVVNNIESDSGISSVIFNSNIQIGSGTTIHSSGIDLGTGNLKGHNLESTGIITATTFVGNLTGNPTGSGANLTNLPAANITGTLPAIDGSNLTGVGVGTADSINTSGIITATAFVSDTPLSHRNIITNGAMRVAQRASSSTTSGYGDLDRWKHEYAGTNENPTFAQVSLTTSDTPYTLGLTKAARITNGNQTSGLQANSQINFNQQIEAQDIRNSGWNYKSSSSYITLSFWVRSSVSQNFNGFVKTTDGSMYIYPYETGTLSANTWTKITKSIPGNSNLQIDDDNGAGFQVFAIAIYGTDYTNNSVTYNQWAGWSSASRSKDQANSWFTTNDATLEITGVQLEVGPVATPFEHRSFGDELRRCQRYFQKMVDTDGVYFGGGYMYDHYRGYLPVTHYVTMRAAPSMQTVTGSNYYSLHRNGSGDNFDGFNNWFAADENHGTLQTTSGLSGTGGQAGQYWSNNAACKITFSAEL